MIAQTIRLLFSCYTIFLILRIISSWFPKFRHHNFMRFIAYYTDPYLNIFKKIIPPIGGIIDISPLIGFIFLQLLEKILFNFIK